MSEDVKNTDQEKDIDLMELASKVWESRKLYHKGYGCIGCIGSYCCFQHTG